MKSFVFFAGALAVGFPAWSATYDIFFEVGASGFSDASGVVYDSIKISEPPPAGFVPELITVTGRIETDGTTGMLLSENILSWSISIEDASQGVSFSFDSTDPISYFEIDYQPPGNLGPVASADGLSLVIGDAGTEMEWQYYVVENGTVQLGYDIALGPDINEVVVNTPSQSVRYETSYFGSGIDALEIATSFTGTDQPPAVPLPPSILMIVAAMLGLGWMGRRRATGAA